MQRMIVGLVLFLTAIVGVLGVSVLNLSDRIGEQRAQPPTTTPRPTFDPRPVANPEQLDALQKQLADLQRVNRRLTDRLGQVESEARLARAEARRARMANGEDVTDDDPMASAMNELLRDEQGKVLVTDEQVEQFVAIQKQVERKRRITGMTRNVMRRIDRMADKGEIGALTPEARAELESKIRAYVAEGDDLVTRYIRDPSEEIGALSTEQRKDRMTAERDGIVAAAQLELEPIVGQHDAATIAENSLQNPWGVRLRGDRSRRRNR